MRNKLQKFIWIRAIAVVVLFVSICLLFQGIFLGYITSNILVRKISGDYSLGSLFTRGIVFNNINIQKPNTLYSDVGIGQLTIKPDYKTLFSDRVMIETVEFKNFVINSTYSENKNNIKEIQRSILAYFKNAKTLPGNKATIIKKLLIKNIYLNTLQGRDLKVTVLPDMAIYNISSKRGMKNSILAAVSYAISLNVDKHDPRGLWEQYVDYSTVGSSITFNLKRDFGMMAGKVEFYGKGKTII